MVKRWPTRGNCTLSLKYQHLALIFGKKVRLQLKSVQIIRLRIENLYLSPKIIDSKTIVESLINLSI